MWQWSHMTFPKKCGHHFCISKSGKTMWLTLFLIEKHAKHNKISISIFVKRWKKVPRGSGHSELRNGFRRGDCSFRFTCALTLRTDWSRLRRVLRVKELERIWKGSESFGDVPKGQRVYEEAGSSTRDAEDVRGVRRCTNDLEVTELKGNRVYFVRLQTEVTSPEM